MAWGVETFLWTAKKTIADLKGEDATIINEKMRAFEEKEKMRVKNAMSDHEIKAARKLKELHEKNLAAIRELEEIHVSRIVWVCFFGQEVTFVESWTIEVYLRYFCFI